MKQLHRWYGDDVQFLDVIIRQAHPGEVRGHFENFEKKMDGAREYKQLEDIAWPVLVDDYAGTVHRTYSNEMADPTFLIDSEGQDRVLRHVDPRPHPQPRCSPAVRTEDPSPAASTACPTCCRH